MRRTRKKRYADWLPPPIECRYCKRLVKYVNNSAIYGRSIGRWPMIYLCKPCDAYVGCHDGTCYPLGTLANKALRHARKVNKAHFEPLWQQGPERKFETRTAAYEWLARELRIPPSKCHWGMFELDRAIEAGLVCYRMRFGDKPLVARRDPKHQLQMLWDAEPRSALEAGL